MTSFDFTAEDLQQIKAHGLTKSQVQDQLQIFENGIPYAHLEAAATLGNGIQKLSKTEREHYSAVYNTSNRETVKFIPASGAATRMFKLLIQFFKEIDSGKCNEVDHLLLTSDFDDLNPFFDQIKDFPFYKIVEAQLQKNKPDYPSLSADEKACAFVKYMLYNMNYAALPKGLIPFHQYTDKTTTPFEEHFYETSEYAERNGQARLHFSVAEEHLDNFKRKFKAIKPRLDREIGVEFDIDYSFQDKSTDTIAVDSENQPFRDKEGRLFFRPGGHGTLIRNLNAIDADIVFIKNVDNVVPQEDLSTVVEYKKALAGLLITMQEEIFTLLTDLDESGFSKNLKKRAEKLALDYFHQDRNFGSKAAIKSFFDRPLRVCGMVKNEGQPGGGPFWVKEEDAINSLQIVEGAQIDTSDNEQAQILQNATHFNPVDLVCGLKDYKGNKFDLQEFINPNEGFISKKSKEGRELKALEWPGLWNGAMAYWNTIFAEVPLETFNPVKTVTDLLKPGHQPSME